MSKGTLEFNLPEEQDEFETAQDGWKFKSQVEEIWNKVFRPRHKHGYGSEELNRLVNSKNGNKLMDLLEELYREAVKEYEDSPF